MTPLPLSFTLLDKHRTCPKQLYHLKVVKDVREESNEALVWGNLFHKAVEDAIASGTPLPPEMTQYQGLIDAIPRDCEVEVELAVNKNLQPCKFFAKDVFLRAKTDLLRRKGSVARAGDWKTGKNRKITDQMLINALLIFLTYPEIDTVHTDFFWLQHKAKDSQVWTRAGIPDMWAKLLPDMKLYRDDFHSMNFPPRPSGLCNGWCPVKQCSHWRPKKEKR